MKFYQRPERAELKDRAKALIMAAQVRALRTKAIDQSLPYKTGPKIQVVQHIIAVCNMQYVWKAMSKSLE